MAQGRLIQDNGQPRYGIFSEPVTEVNYLDFDLRNSMNKPRSERARRKGCNRFQFVGLLSPELIVGCAIVDLNVVSNAFVYFYDIKADELAEYSFLQPFGRNTRLVTSPDFGTFSFDRGANKFRIIASNEPLRRTLSVELKDGSCIEAEITEPKAFNPLRICTRAGYTGWVYTQKAAALPVTGKVKALGREYDLQQIGALGSYDWTAGFMRRETFWNWACISGRLADSRRIGLNFAAGVNETGFTENGFWLEDAFTKVSTVDFRFDRDHPLSPWMMRSADGRAALKFEPAGERKERVNAVVVASNFTQVFGHYTGKLKTAAGEIVELQRVPGFAEDHYARW